MSVQSCANKGWISNPDKIHIQIPRIRVNTTLYYDWYADNLYCERVLGGLVFQISKHYLKHLSRCKDLEQERKKYGIPGARILKILGIIRQQKKAFRDIGNCQCWSCKRKIKIAVWERQGDISLFMLNEIKSENDIKVLIMILFWLSLKVDELNGENNKYIGTINLKDKVKKVSSSWFSSFRGFSHSLASTYI